jgi:hypothetical protein
MSNENCKEYILVGIGNALLDFFVYDSEAVEKLIEKYEFIPKPIVQDINKIDALYVLIYFFFLDFFFFLLFIILLYFDLH